MSTFTIEPIPFYLYTHVHAERSIGIQYIFSPLGRIDAHNYAYRMRRVKCYFANHEDR